jgi:enoyl-CoA hydratase/carnithine racemase
MASNLHVLQGLIDTCGAKIDDINQDKAKLDLKAVALRSHAEQFLAHGQVEEARKAVTDAEAAETQSGNLARELKRYQRSYTSMQRQLNGLNLTLRSLRRRGLVLEAPSD